MRTSDIATLAMQSDMTTSNQVVPVGGISAANTKRNVIILTSGISGSSVLTGLIARAGYWTGDKTHKKEYDTYENEGLIRSNLRLFREAAYTGDYASKFTPDDISRIAALSGKIDEQPFLHFLEDCNQHRPWVWKDPRLWLTIRYWKKFLLLENCSYLLLTRSFIRCWVSSNLRRHITSYGELKGYEQAIQHTFISFLNDNKLPYLHLTYEALIAQPEETIQRLNAFLGTHLTVDDLVAIYHKPLYKLPRSSAVDFVRAVLIYVKNYSERVTGRSPALERP
jgi:hypothetical protein